MQQVNYLHNLHKKWICIHVYTWRIYLTTYMYRYRVLQNLSNINNRVGFSVPYMERFAPLALWSAQPSMLFVDVAKTSGTVNKLKYQQKSCEHNQDSKIYIYRKSLITELKACMHVYHSPFMLIGQLS